MTTDEVFKDQPVLESFKTTIPALWKQQGHSVSRMWHAFLPDGKSEILMIPTPGMSEQEGKEAEAAFVTSYCKDRQPVALAQITEAWAFEPPKDLKPDMNRIYSDSAYYREFKKKCVRKELLFVHVETPLGVVAYSWYIDRSGTEPVLTGFTESARPHTPGPTGRFEGFLKPNFADLN